jgi:hypothetical protein
LKMTNSPKYIESLLFSVQFCGTLPSEPHFLQFYLNMFHQVL